MSQCFFLTLGVMRELLFLSSSVMRKLLLLPLIGSLSSNKGSNYRSASDQQGP